MGYAECLGTLPVLDLKEWCSSSSSSSRSLFLTQPLIFVLTLIVVVRLRMYSILPVVATTVSVAKREQDGLFQWHL